MSNFPFNKQINCLKNKLIKPCTRFVQMLKSLYNAAPLYNSWVETAGEQDSSRCNKQPCCKVVDR